MKPPCFISYCWTNSADAIKKGSKSRKGGIGWGDPRQFKDFFESNNIPCWIDVERVGQVSDSNLKIWMVFSVVGTDMIT